MATNFQEVATQFVPFYYQKFDTNREELGQLYRDSSMLTYESASVLGVAAIVDKLKNLPMQNIKHETATIDPMPGFGEGGVLIQVTGFIHLADGDEAQAFKFAQTFHLAQEAGTGSYYVSHDIFKLIF